MLSDLNDFQDIITPDDGSADWFEARALAREFEATLDEADRHRERTSGLWLAAEWFALIGITYGIVYGIHSVWLKVTLLIPWSLYSSFALDNITHYANHWPLFRTDIANRLWRYSGVLVFFNPLEIGINHNDHHRAYSRADNNEQIFSSEDRGRSFLSYLISNTFDGIQVLFPLRPVEPCVTALGRRRPDQLREIVALRWSFLGWAAILSAISPQDTLLFFFPSVILIGAFASLSMNLTDHIPGDSRHPFRLATWDEPETAIAALASVVNHQTCATHLTHHLFPRIHWIHLRKLQNYLSPIYVRQNAPKSLIVNSSLLGNPIRLALVLKQIALHRFDGL